MKQALLFLILITFSLEQSLLKRSQRSKHGEDCVSDIACEEKLICHLNRCMTRFESRNTMALGLYEKNICNPTKKCPEGKKCVKHRCVDSSAEPETTRVNTANEEDVHLLFSGTIWLNLKPYLSGLKSDNTFNYDHLFTHISKYIKGADLAVAHQETVFHIDPEEKKFKKNIKNTPKELGDAISKAGFKLVLHGTFLAYNHKEQGIINTLKFWKTNHPNVHVLGISATEEEHEKDYYIYEHSGIKIGIINFSGSSLTSIPTKNKHMVNVLNKKTAESIVEKVKAKSDFVIVCIDWGKKANRTPAKSQIILAKQLVSYGVNLIVGNRPSEINPITFVKSKNGNCGLVFWSLGTLVGDTEKNFSNLGALANVVITKGKGKAYISSYNLIPVINHKGESNEYSVYKLSEYSENLGLQIDRKFSMKRLKTHCEFLTGAFAHCD